MYKHYFQTSSRQPFGQSKPFLYGASLDRKHVYIDDLLYMTKMAAMTIYGKNLLLRNEMSDDRQTWHGASATQSLYKC